MSKRLTRRSVLATAGAAAAVPAAARPFTRVGGGGGSGLSPPVITSSLSASGTTGVFFSYQITATNSPTSFNATGLPTGISVNTSTGLISGTTSSAGVSTVPISATNAAGTGSANLTLTISPPGVGSPFITGVTMTGTPRTDSFTVGFQVDIGATPLTLTDLGRYANGVTGHTHTITVYDAATQVAVPGATAVVDTTGATLGTFVYASVSGTPVLWNGRSYFVVDTEGSGDTWYDDVGSGGTLVATTADAGLSHSIFFNTSAMAFQTGPGGVNQPYVPTNFKYTVGAPGAITLAGSPWGALFPADSVLASYYGQNPVVSGTIGLFASTVHGPVPTGTITYQWTIDGVVKSPVISSTNPVLPWTCDTVALSIPDGTHIVRPQILDSTDVSIFNINTQGRPIIVANSGFNNGSQTVPVAAYNSNRPIPGVPDFVAYDASTPNPVHATYPMAYTFIPGAANVSSPYHSNPALLRDSTKWFGECWPGPRNQEYLTNPEWAATTSGGIYAAFFDPLDNTSVTTATSYLGIVANNSMDGTRLNTFISGFSTFVEDPAGGGTWWGVEINGRVFTLTNDGTITTIIGRTRNRTIPTYDPTGYGLTESDYNTRITDIGTFPIGVDNLGGANDLCFDPTDSNILYVVAQVDNWIARINLTTLVVTVYAGTPGASNGYTGDGGPAASATFAAPTSIIMDGSRNMYVCDSQNSAIRKILPPTGTVAGNISTLCGGTVGPSTTGLLAAMPGGTGYAVASISWSGSSGVVVMSAPITGLQIGYTLRLSGAINTGGSGDPNTGSGVGDTPRYIVTAFTDTSHFTLGFEQSVNPPTIGTLSGSMTLTTMNSDTYSSPNSVGFASAYVPFPNVIRFASGGDIIFGEPVTECARRIHLGSSTITRVGIFQNHLEADTNQQWLWLDVDTAGMIGPVDDVVIFKIQNGISAAHLTWRLGLTDSYSNEFFGDGFGLPTYGPVNEVIGGPGHYPWAIGISRTEGRWIGTGMAHFQTISGRITQPSDPVVDHNTGTNYNTGLAVNGGQIYLYGTTAGFPRDIRPSFWSLRGTTGCGFITKLSGADTFEDLMATYPTDGALATYIQGGMGGAVPRPEIVGNQMRDLIYTIRRGTLQGSLPTPTQPGAADTNTTVPVILTASAVRNTSTQITVSWTTDIATLGMVAAQAPGQMALSQPPSIFSALESSFGTSHSMAVQVLSGVSPVHFIVVCESAHGIFARTIDLTVV